MNLAEQPYLISAVIDGPLALVLVLLMRRIRRERAAQEVLNRRDSLTGLPNRVKITADLNRILQRLPRAEDQDHDGSRGPALLLLDLDGFKDINDILGHASGDAVLIQVAHQLEVAAGESTHVARVGGDEFAVLIPRNVSQAQALLEAKKILAALGASSYTADGPALEIRGSIGIAQAPRDGRDASELWDNAEMALRSAKRDRSGAVLYTPARDVDPSRDPRGTLSMLRGAMDDGQLRLRYQPLVSADQSRVVGFEALLRWENPQRGLMLPAEFVPMAERTSLIHPLTRWVLLTSLQQASAWRSMGMPDFSMSVNVSSAVLEEGLLGIVEEALALSQWPADRLVIELTETALSQSVKTARTVVSALRERGVRVSVDDFGAGYTSLGQLGGLPVHELKVDRQFVEQLGGRSQEAITKSIIDLGHRLGLEVVAEGVETMTAARRLRELGVDVLQGYLFARPLPAENVPQWLSAFPNRSLNEEPPVRVLPRQTGAPPARPRS